MSKLQPIVYKVVFEIEPAAEMAIANRLGLQHEISVNDGEVFLGTQGPTVLKITPVDAKTLFSEVTYDTKMFVVKGIELSNVELHEILHMYPLGLEIRASVHGYAWPRFDVKIHFVYMVAFGGRIFMEVHGKSRETVLKAKEYLWSHEFHREITVPYNQLRPQY